VIVGTGGEEYQVVNTVPETHPERCGGLQIDTGIYDVDTVLEHDGDAFAYITTGDASSELKILPGGPGGSGGGSSNLEGTYTSPYINLGFPTVLNRLSLTTALPDGTPDTVFSAPAGIPFDDDGAGYENPAQCARYKLFLATDDVLVTPLVHEVILNYSP
jgi:hypothetical protein